MKWISVKDKLPEVGVPVLVYLKNEFGKGRRLRAQWSDGKSLEADEEWDNWAVYDEQQDMYFCPEGWFETNEYEETHWQIEDEVTHWMPLPEPPIEA